MYSLYPYYTSNFQIRHAFYQNILHVLHNNRRILAHIYVDICMDVTHVARKLLSMSIYFRTYVCLSIFVQPPDEDQQHPLI